MEEIREPVLEMTAREDTDTGQRAGLEKMHTDGGHQNSRGITREYNSGP